MKKALLLTFALASVIHLGALATGDRTAAMWSKPVLIPLLGAWFAAPPSVKPLRPKVFWVVLGVLSFSTLGDIALMFSGQMAFFAGLSSFLLAHICYIAAFNQLEKWSPGLVRKKSWVVGALLFYTCSLLAYLWKGIPPPLQVPVAVYSLVIAGMALSVANLYKESVRRIFWPMMAGALLFVLSDSLIAVSKFRQVFEGTSLVIMATYLLGQYLLVDGAAKFSV